LWVSLCTQAAGFIDTSWEGVLKDIDPATGGVVGCESSHLLSMCMAAGLSIRWYNTVHHGYLGGCPSLLKGFLANILDYFCEITAALVVLSHESCSPLLDGFHSRGMLSSAGLLHDVSDQCLVAWSLGLC